MLTPDILSGYIQDDPRFNLLLDNKEQFDEDFIEEIIRMTYLEAGATVPALRNSTNRIPSPIILHGALSNLMRSESFKELRNQLQYNDNNLSSISVFHKHNDYLKLAFGLKEEFKILLSNYAASEFIASAWGTTTSNANDYESLYVFTGNEFFGIL
jgi:hypothetical protein